MNLGHIEYCLNVKNLEKSLAFYRSLGFEDEYIQMDRKYAILKYRNSILGLFQGHISENLINFRGGNVPEIHQFMINLEIPTENKVLNEDGSGEFLIHDPDGNGVYFDTSPKELEK
jgi:predicted lactoylglutathione lyase